jgi:hypothetical protein
MKAGFIFWVVIISALIYHVLAFSPHTIRQKIHRGPTKQLPDGHVILDLSISNPKDDCSPQGISDVDLCLFSELMSPVASAQPDQMSASALAYLGDVVFELFIRSRYVWPQRRMPQLQNTVVSLVNGEYHATSANASRK